MRTPGGWPAARPARQSGWALAAFALVLLAGCRPASSHRVVPLDRLRPDLRRGGLPGTLLVVTFDEGTTSPYNHFALLRSIERRFGLPLLRNAADPTTKTIPGHRRTTAEIRPTSRRLA